MPPVESLAIFTGSVEGRCIDGHAVFRCPRPLKTANQPVKVKVIKCYVKWENRYEPAGQGAMMTGGARNNRQTQEGRGLVRLPRSA